MVCMHIDSYNFLARPRGERGNHGVTSRYGGDGFPRWK